eukprot:TRINITY_DN16506_c0_g1_i2.p1 TRINITY_DN16506_c0_g1~~TRINITY_DN16506_c0_g1_i2.p1  ORF type:complete len:203 (-),score=10.05 TRINITY_DN16506_c0_g1_i2:266-790(-)
MSRDDTRALFCFLLCAVEATTFGIHGLLFLTDPLHGWGTALLTGWEETDDGGGLAQVDGPPAFPAWFLASVGLWMTVLSTLAVTGWPLLAQGMLAVVVGGILHTRLRGPLKACPVWMALPSICYYEFTLAVSYMLGTLPQFAAVALSPVGGWCVAHLVGRSVLTASLETPLLKA